MFLFSIFHFSFTFSCFPFLMFQCVHVFFDLFVSFKETNTISCVFFMIFLFPICLIIFSSVIFKLFFFQSPLAHSFVFPFLCCVCAPVGVPESAAFRVSASRVLPPLFSCSPRRRNLKSTNEKKHENTASKRMTRKTRTSNEKNI